MEESKVEMNAQSFFEIEERAKTRKRRYAESIVDDEIEKMDLKEPKISREEEVKNKVKQLELSFGLLNML